MPSAAYICYDIIYHESLLPANMVKNHHLAKSIADAGWSAFLSILSFNAAEAGTTVVAVPAAFTSQVCSGCGVHVHVHKGLSVRWHTCPERGTSLRRAHNAALNILRLGRDQRGAGQTPQALTWAMGPSVVCPVSGSGLIGTSAHETQAFTSLSASVSRSRATNASHHAASRPLWLMNMRAPFAMKAPSRSPV
jgi:hypothetical protein